MLYATGDTHCDFRRFNVDNFPEQREMTRDDYVLILGDFGIWDNRSRENYWMDWLNSKPWTTIFIDGNHENADILDYLPVSEWNGGNVHFIRPSVIHLMRGQVFDIDNKKVFTFGGAQSHDIPDGILEPSDNDFLKKRKTLDARYADYRINHRTWWVRELPSQEEMQEGLKNLAMHNWQVDYIVTHCPPTEYLKQMDAGRGKYKPDNLTDYLQAISDKCLYKTWLFGHMHDNKQITNKHNCLYEQIVKIW
jgi:hypothetical protein